MLIGPLVVTPATPPITVTSELFKLNRFRFKVCALFLISSVSVAARLIKPPVAALAVEEVIPATELKVWVPVNVSLTASPARMVVASGTVSTRAPVAVPVKRKLLVPGEPLDPANHISFHGKVVLPKSDPAAVPGSKAVLIATAARLFRAVDAPPTPEFNC